MSADDPARVTPLVCVECGRDQADDERRWLSYPTTDDEESAEAVHYCPLRRA